MHQTGKKIGWPDVRQGDELIIGNPHHSKTINVSIRYDNSDMHLDGMPRNLRIGPGEKRVITPRGYVNIRSRAVIDSELRLA